jgi:hypothetical protein
MLYAGGQAGAQDSGAKPAAAAPSPSRGYIIGPADVLQINVWKEPDLTRDVTVRVDGMITVPLVGDIEAAGRTPGQLAESLGSSLGRFVEVPRVTVAIGQAIGRRLEASLVPVSYHSRNPAAGVAYKHYPDLIEMAKAVDTLIVIVPGGASTAKMINADVLKALGPRGVVINVARGSVVDEPALIAALKSGTILAAGLDVFANEPNVPDELRTMQNAVLLPHIGSASVVTRNAMDQLMVDNLKAWFAGKPPLTPVPETPVKSR